MVNDSRIPSNALRGLGAVLASLLICGLVFAQEVNTNRIQTQSGENGGTNQIVTGGAATASPSRKGLETSVAPSSAVSSPNPDTVAPAKAAADKAAGETESVASPQVRPVCNRVVKANVVAFPKAFMMNRLGAGMPQGLIFALKGDVTIDANNYVSLKPYKRPRPIVLRANEGDCLEITFSNFVGPNNNPPTASPTGTPQASIHVQGMQMVQNISSDGSYVGRNETSLADAPPLPNTKVYTLFAERAGTYLLYTEGDTSTTGLQLKQGLFGAVHVEPKGAIWYRSQVTGEDLKLASTGSTPLGQPIVNYNAVYPPGNARAGKPILKMLDGGNNIVHSDLTAIIAGPERGRFPGVNGSTKEDPPCSLLNTPIGAKLDPNFCANPALPDRKAPYREFTIIYHLMNTAVQAFPVFNDASLSDTIAVGGDNFGINYGTGGIGAEIYANRIGVGPMGSCVDCKFEEFFLSAWSVGDPAMLVDTPANAPCNTAGVNAGGDPGCVTPGARTPTSGFPYKMQGTQKAKVAYFPDDPSNVYHSYMNDHVQFRILHGGTDVTHVHHQHAHQWLQSPNSDNSSYLDSQMISPGASYTLDMVYNGSGNVNKTVGDSIFHCHFYPHFASGMWSMWRVHDVFEAGTAVCLNQQPAGCQNLPDGTPVPGTRAYPDGEIANGTPIPGLVPMPSLPMAIPPSPVFIQNGQVVYGTLGSPDPDGSKVKINPGYPFTIPGVAGMRPPHPPLDFATDGGNILDGGLPRHVNTGGSIANEQHTQLDWSKDFATLNSKQLPEDGTKVEKVAIAYYGQRCHPSFLPNGAAAPCNKPCASPGSKLQGGFLMNGLPRGPQHGAPFADPAVDLCGVAVGKQRTYKAAAFQLNVTFNKSYGWHFPQQRMLSLWNDVKPTLDYKFPNPSTATARQPEPLFMRANSKTDFVEYWHTNLIPNYYLVDDFQVRTPTDIIGQHIHLVKFDVTSSDGAGNGYNYEDGTFSPDEVRELIKAINNKPNKPGIPNGSWTPCAGCPLLRSPQPPPAGICGGPNPPPQCATDWIGAQTTIQRWYVDPLLNDDKKDRTMRTVFTHDHFGPSTHQQAGLYAGLLTEPQDAKWSDPETGQMMGGAGVAPVRPDGGPTSWKVDVLTGLLGAQSYREFALEFQDFQLAYATAHPAPNPYPNPAPDKGFRDLQNAVGPVNLTQFNTPYLISGAPPPGTMTLNYLNEPVLPRVGTAATSDLSSAFDSTYLSNGDPITPLLRGYENDRVQIRVLVGAHMLAHYFTLGGINWFAEAGTPQDPLAINNSGHRSSQAMGLSEHFELLFRMPPSSVTGSKKKCPDNYASGEGDCVDYLYSPSYNDSGLANGLWGLIRAYDPTTPFSKLKPLPKASNPIGKGSLVAPYKPCPILAPKRTFNITAVTAEKAISGGSIVYNSRGKGTGDLSTALKDPNGILYVRSEDLNPSGTLKQAAPREPLILRALAGECIEVNLTNALDPASSVFSASNQSPISFVGVQQAGNTQIINPPFTVNSSLTPSKKVGLTPQLLAFDAATSTGINIGFNKVHKDQTAAFNGQVKYTWYAGTIERAGLGHLLHYTPVEFGSLNLFAADVFLQHTDGLFGAMVVEPKGSKWSCDRSDGTTGPCEPVLPSEPPLPGGPTITRASATVSSPAGRFREFVAMVSDDVRIYTVQPGYPPKFTPVTNAAVNYRTEPTYYRYGNLTPQNFAPTGTAGDNDCALSNALVGGDPLTPLFQANPGDQVRFRLMHPHGTGTSQVFTLNGHVWQRNPYQNFSARIGNNAQSQWIGSRDNHGASDHFDLVFGSAGGKNRVAGDYLYGVFLPDQINPGSWGVMRVTGGAVSTKPCPQLPPQQYTVTPPKILPRRAVPLFVRPAQPAPKSASNN